MSAESYFLYHSIGIYPGKTADLAAAMAGFAGVWGAADDGQWAHVLPLRARFIDRWRAILGGRAHRPRKRCQHGPGSQRR